MDWVLLGLVTLFAAAVQGTIGFAFTLLAVSFFLLILESEAVQVTLVLNLVICGSLCRRLWRDVPVGLWRLLLTGALLGVPVGVIAFAYASLGAIYAAVAVVILAFTAVLARQKAPTKVAGESGQSAASTDTAMPYRTPSVLAVGVVAGAMTASLSMPGPVLVLYLTAIGVDKATFRAVSLTLFTALRPRAQGPHRPKPAGAGCPAHQ